MLGLHSHQLMLRQLQKLGSNCVRKTDWLYRASILLDCILVLGLGPTAGHLLLDILKLRRVQSVSFFTSYDIVRSQVAVVENL